jgi:rfaE bifunctional protein nucleotidyltransferase chain/domain
LLSTTNTLKGFVERKTLAPGSLEESVSLLRSCGKTIVTLNGSFDLLHAGHLQIIFEAAQQGDVLIAALNSDASIRAYKSPSRPIVPLSYRLQMMAALEFVDYVTWFDETDPRSLLSRICPDVHVNGSEYGENCIEADTVRKNGGRIHIVPLVPGLSTSQIIAKIQTL